MLPATAPVSVRMDDLRVVSTFVDGKGPYHFILDTGAAVTVITPQLARRMAFSGGARRKVTGTGGSENVASITLRDVRVGRADVRNVAAVIVPLPLDVTYQGEYGSIDGILGYTFLSHFAVTFDIARDTATFTRSVEYAPPQHAVVVPVDLSDGTPVVEAQADGVSGRFKLDTGGFGAITLSTAFAAAHDFKGRYPDAQPDVFEGVGGIHRGLVIRLQQFVLAGFAIPNEQASLALGSGGIFADSSQAGTIGVDVLRRFSFTIDYPRRRADFRANTSLEAYVPYRESGVRATRQPNGTLRVFSVDPGSVGARAGIQAGDILVALNGDPIASLDLAQLQEANRADQIELLVRSHGLLRHITLSLPDSLPRS